MKGEILYISAKEATEFILPRHYAGRKPQISYAFGWFFNGQLKAVVTFGKPASPALCKGICGDEFATNVIELNRLVRTEDMNEPLSQFVAAAIRRLSFEDRIIVSYSDKGMSHNGYIYQALNFLFTGQTKERLQFHVPNGHSRHGSKDSELREVRTAKNRYVFFATRKKYLKKVWLKALRYPVLPYPKDESGTYELGTVFKPTVVNIKQVTK